MWSGEIEVKLLHCFVQPAGAVAVSPHHHVCDKAWSVNADVLQAMAARGVSQPWFSSELGYCHCHRLPMVCLVGNAVLGREKHLRSALC